MKHQLAAKLAEDFHEAAQLARTEEDLRIAGEALLKDALKHVGLETTASYERTYADHGGRSDAVYGRVVIEYEPVGALNTPGGVAHAAEQLERYLRGEAGGDSSPEALQRMVGVGLDGHRIFFLRFLPQEDDPLDLLGDQGMLPIDEAHGSGPQKVHLEGPHWVDAASIQTLFVYLRAAHRTRLTADGLAAQFGPSGPCAKKVVGTLYARLTASGDHPLVQTLFGEWDRIFGIVYGGDLDRVGKHIQLLQTAYGIDGTAVQFKPLLFSVHTYYAVLMKVLAAEVVALQRGSLIESFVDDLAVAQDDALLRRLESVESGELLSRYMLHNFLEADFFGWYLKVWDGALAEDLRFMARLLAAFEPATGVLDPAPTQDLLKRLYQYLIPKEIRHDLGEYYTPTWLAEFTLDEAGYHGQPGRVLDPACGTGTFLVSTLRRRLNWARTQGEFEADRVALAQNILGSIVGFELNPLAVIAARTNYLLAAGAVLRVLPDVEIPVYLCDSILTPVVADVSLLGDNYELKTSVGKFEVPTELVASESLPTATNLLEDALSGGYTSREFLRRCQRELPSVTDAELATLGTLFGQLDTLHREGRDGVWARIIRNAFAPVLSGLFDFVVGNPPWVNWQSLSAEYRAATQGMWVDYGLFSLSGSQGRLGGGKKDLAALFVYRATDAYLRSGGTLSFVVPQSLLKGKQASDGFRRFQIGVTGAFLGMKRAHDFEALQPFEGASTKTVVIALRKGEKTTYPIPYTVWKPARPRTRISPSDGLDDVKAKCAAIDGTAQPVSPLVATSPWLTTTAGLGAAIAPAMGRSAYRAFIGVCTWANGIYWLKVTGRLPGGLIQVENLREEAKDQSSAPQLVSAAVEPNYVYPLVRSRDIHRWVARPSVYMLIPQDPQRRKGVDESQMRVDCPRTYKFLKSFEGALTERSGLKKYFNVGNGDAFYSVYNFSEASLGSYRVVWRQMVRRITAAVLEPIDDPWLGRAVPQTQHVVSVVNVDSKDEAHYLCAMMNSSATTAISISYSTGKSYGIPSLMENVRIPKFDPKREIHARLAVLAQLAATKSEAGEPLDDVELAIDQLASQVFGLSDDGAAEIRGWVSGVPVEEGMLPIGDEES